MNRDRITLAATLVALLVLLTVGAPIASADTISFTLAAGNSDISAYAGPYATVTVNRTDSTHATITFASLTSGGNIFLLGDGGSVAVNVNAAIWTLSGITGGNAGTGFLPATYSDGNAGNEDGWGSFNQTINNSDGFKNSSDTISFTLTNTSGTWANAGNVLTANASGYFAAAHIFVTESPAVRANGALVTGYASGGPTSVPDGGMTLILLGGALVGLEALRRRLRV